MFFMQTFSIQYPFGLFDFIVYYFTSKSSLMQPMIVELFLEFENLGWFIKINKKKDEL